MKKPETLLDALRNHVDTQGDKSAFTFLKSDEESISVSYRDLDARAQQIAHHLLTVAKPGDRALMMYQAGIDFIEAFLGCLYAGIVAVPAYPPKKNRNAERILTIAQDCTPRLLLCSAETRRNVEAEIAGSVANAPVIVTDQLESVSGGSLPELQADQLAFLQYTSGSTAVPKGVMVTHGNIVANELLIQKYFQFAAHSVMVSWLPMFHDMGLIGGILGPLFVGAPSILMAPNTFLRDPIKWLQTVSDYKATVTGAPNFAYELCAKRITPEQKSKLDLSTLHVAFNGSEPVRAETLERFSQEFAECGFRPNAFFPCYGMAETTLLVSGGPPLAETKVITVDLSQLEQHRIVETEEGRPLVSCGQIGADLEVRIVNPETLAECSDNEVGEIWAHGDSVAKGYWQREEASLSSFQAKLPGDERNWLRTGDYGFLRDGTLYVTGRLKDLIIIRGRNIYPQDIEELVEQHFDAILPNCCAAFSIESGGEEKLLVVAAGSREMVRWSNSPHGPNGELVKLNHKIDALRSDILNEFEVALTDLVFVRPTTFPTTSSGKVQRQLTKRKFESGEFEVLFESEVRTPETVETSPSGAAELTALICETLQEWSRDEEQRLPPLDGHTTFTSLGIDSLAAADIGARLEKKLGCVIEADTLYDHHTIAELSQFLSRCAPGSAADAGANRGPLSQEDYLGFYKDKLKRFHHFREAGHDYFGTPIGHQQGSYVQVGDRKMLMMASYSYLGLINRPEVNQAAEEAIQSYGTGAHGVRLLAGTFDAHRELEKEIADFFHADDAIVYSSGFMTNMATVAALVGKGDVVIGDELNHASIVDGCQFSAATFLMFPHNNLQALEAQLKEHSGKRILVIVDAVYSMEGDVAPLPEIVQLCRQYGAMLMVDEAHSLGVIGEYGRGIQEYFNLPDDAIDIKMGTLSKSIASCGGFIAARQEIIDYLKCNARGFIFSASLPAAQVGAARKCFEIIRREKHLAGHLRKLRDQFVNGLRQLGYEVPPTESAVVPIIFPTEQETLEATGYCRDNGLFVVPVFYPAVPMDKPRIRATVTASLTEDDVDAALSVFQALAIARGQSGEKKVTTKDETDVVPQPEFCDPPLTPEVPIRPTR
ncbi:aminotransferase class I/II-fold pyridoxal phosphate-dependent enzyme [Blastopirellula sp. JC732]|uniref:Aminotransferase class I/II-fold pyridoxal phosphate-dependent enzyme n=1 Tax=Blastopirellula sediminis TaxID=2894196 RepID=A0A9X1MRH9_9BACT|nr:aminotransferase class I/II-fold pyridoxal phosphate-dependent enzyme [Blastopirellula sediminis]MCC9606428.1 aminotransferase class I/II-fold pyridoxal phosphate-dependent enzyme [Blastopirellula sediminis]MCC9630274.1 aminotransferase class I/II-fold pyridoxal phosphate-dependent enzyme [Blastopirellula sediminis]